MSQTLENQVALAGTIGPSANTAELLPAGGSSLLRWASVWVALLSVSAVVSAAWVMAAHGARGFFLPVLAAAVCLLAALFDGGTSRIPNPLTYVAILAGLLLNGLAPLLALAHLHIAAVWLGAVGWQSSLLGFLVCSGLGIVGCLLAGVHGGDLKLLAAVGALLGLMPTANALMVALGMALIYSVLNLMLLGGLNAVVFRAAMRAMELVYLHRIETPLPDEPTHRASHIPMAVPLAIGLIVAQIWEFRVGGRLP